MPQIQTGNLSKEQVLTALIKYALEMLQAYGIIETNIDKLLANNQAQIKQAALSDSSIGNFVLSNFTLPLGVDLSGVNKGPDSKFFSDTYDANYEAGAAQAAIENVPANKASIRGAPTPATQYFAKPKPARQISSSIPEAKTPAPVQFAKRPQSSSTDRSTPITDPDSRDSQSPTSEVEKGNRSPKGGNKRKG